MDVHFQARLDPMITHGMSEDSLWAKDGGGADIFEGGREKELGGVAAVLFALSFLWRLASCKASSF